MNRKLKSRIVEIYGSQTVFSREVQEAEPVVSRVIHGHVELPDERKRAWAKALKASTRQLFGKGER